MGKWRWRALSALLVGTILLGLAAPVAIVRADTGPTWPDEASLLLTEVAENAVSLAWDPAIAEAGVNRYEIRVNGGASSVTVTGDVYAATIGGLAANTEYEFAIEAVDNGQLRSEPLTVSVTTLAAGSTLQSAGLAELDDVLEQAIRDQLQLSPDDPLTTEGLQAITHLDAAHWGLSSLEGIGLLTALEYLNLSHNDLKDEDLPALSGFTGLKELNLSYNDITDLTPIYSLTNLENLVATGNQIDDIAGIDALTHLHFLDLSLNRIADMSPLVDLASRLAASELYMYIDANPLDYSANSDVWNIQDRILQEAWERDSYIEVYVHEFSYSVFDEYATLWWASVYSEVEVEAYDIYVDDAYVGSSGTQGNEYPGTEYTVEELTPGQTYSIEIVVNLVNGASYAIGRVTVTTLVNEEVNFPDALLEQTVRNALEIPQDEAVTTIDLARLYDLDLYGLNVADLTGLEYATNLRYLNLAETGIADLSPLRGLSLTMLDLSDNEISDLAILEGISTQRLSLTYNDVYDLAPLDGMMLHSLDLTGNRLSNVDFFDDDGKYTNIMSPFVWGEGGYVDLSGNYLNMQQGTIDWERLQRLDDVLRMYVRADYQRSDVLNWHDGNALDIAELNGDGVTLRWQPVQGAVGYVIYRDNEAVAYREPIPAADGALYAQIGTLSPSTRYTFKVEALTGDGETVSGPHTAVRTPGALELELGLSDSVVFYGETVTAEIRTTGPDHLYTFDVTIDYDETAFEIAHAGDIRLHPDFIGAGGGFEQTVHNEAEGWLRVVGTMLGQGEGLMPDEDGAGLLSIALTAVKGAEVQEAHVRVLEGAQAVTTAHETYVSHATLTETAEVLIQATDIDVVIDASDVYYDGALHLETNMTVPGSDGQLNPKRRYDLSGRVTLLGPDGHHPTYEDVIWSSGDETVATVEDGWITAVGNGTATITVRPKYGEGHREIQVIVATRVEGVSLNITDVRLRPGESVQLEALLQPVQPVPSNREVAWSSSNPAVAAVDANGLVAAAAVGVATITAVTEDGEFADTAVVYVTGTAELLLRQSQTMVEIGDPATVVIGTTMPEHVPVEQFEAVLEYDASMLQVIDLTSVDGNVVLTDHTGLDDRSGVFTVKGYLNEPRGGGFDLFRLTFAAREAGPANIAISAAELVETNGTVYATDAPVTDRIMIADSDVNGAGGLQLNDITLVAQKYGAIGQNMPEDLNHDGKVDIADLVYIMRRYLLMNGAPTS